MSRVSGQTVIDVQVNNNRTTRNSRAWYAVQRAMVMTLIEKVRDSRDDTIAILGAGNCNDLDLRWLAENFRTIDLVDLDAEALSYGVRSQSLPQNSHIRCQAPVDVTGQLYNFKVQPGDDRDDPDIQRLLGDVREASLPVILSEPCDVVVSCCVFTPIVETLTQRAVAADKLAELVLAFRRRHFELLMASLRTGGRAIFISDCVSSETLPELVSLPAEEAGAMLDHCVETSNFFTGLNPYAIAQMLQEPHFSSAIREAHFISPWVWRLSDQHARLTYAFILAKS